MFRTILSLLAVMGLMIAPGLCPCLAEEFSGGATQAVEKSSPAPAAPVHSCCHQEKAAPIAQKMVLPQAAFSQHTAPAPVPGHSVCLCNVHSAAGCSEPRQLATSTEVSPTAFLAFANAVEILLPPVTMGTDRIHPPLIDTSPSQTLLGLDCLLTV